MKAAQLQLALRPRPMAEAMDLGVRLAQDARGSLLRGALPLGLLLAAACATTLELAPWLPSLLLWWAKPWWDRALLHVFARHAFGDATSFAEARRARAAAPWSQTLRWLTLDRLSCWRACSMPVVQLEGQRGAALRARLQVVLNGHRGSASLMQGAYSWIEFCIGLGACSLVAWGVPGMVDDGRGLAGLFSGSPASNAVLYLVHALSVLFVEPFFVASGFAMYLNRRVELEAWDVEQELRHAFAR